jgi:hypothetical protein
MTGAALVEYLMTHSERISAVREVEQLLRDRLDALPSADQAELLHVLILPDLPVRRGSASSGRVRQREVHGPHCRDPQVDGLCTYHHRGRRLRGRRADQNSAPMTSPSAFRQ